MTICICRSLCNGLCRSLLVRLRFYRGVSRLAPLQACVYYLTARSGHLPPGRLFALGNVSWKARLCNSKIVGSILYRWCPPSSTRDAAWEFLRFWPFQPILPNLSGSSTPPLSFMGLRDPERRVYQAGFAMTGSLDRKIGKWLWMTYGICRNATVAVHSQAISMKPRKKQETKKESLCMVEITMFPPDKKFYQKGSLPLTDGFAEACCWPKVSAFGEPPYGRSYTPQASGLHTPIGATPTHQLVFFSPNILKSRHTFSNL